MDGPVRALNKLVAHLEACGHDVLVFAPTTDVPAFEHEGELVSVPSVALPGSRSEYRLGLGLSGDARKRLDAFAPTIVHLAAPDWLGLQALDYARRRSIPAVASFHTRFDTYPRYYGMKWLEPRVTDYLRYFYRRCERVYAPSPSMVDELRRDRIGRDIRLWARGVDHDLFNPARRDLAWRRGKGVPDDAILVAFIGRVVLEKGIDVFAQAVKRAAATDRRVRALVVGDGPERARFEGLLPDAVFGGYLEGADLARAYASADIFLNPSVTETFGNVTLEAMASGVPSVCAAASGSTSLVDDGATGLLVKDARDADAFAAAIVSLAGDAAQRARMGAAARAKSASFNWQTILDRLITDYQAVVAKS
jgi:glycosyltransferase involved in cell wall biosynthesis